MALRAELPLSSVRRRRPQPWVAYRRILVPVVDRDVSEQAMAIACRLAADRHAAVSAVGVVEVPAELPLDADMVDEEEELRPVLAEASALAELYGVIVAVKMLHARAAGEAIVGEAKRARSEIIVLSAPRKPRRSRPAAVFGSTVEYVLKHAPCRVMVAAAPPQRLQ